MLQWNGGTITATSYTGIHNDGTGTITITAGTIKGATNGIHATSTSATIVIGSSSDTLSTTSPCIQGTSEYGIRHVGTIKFYNGVIKGAYKSSAGTAYDCSGTVTLRSGGYTTKTTYASSLYSTVLSK